MEVIKEKGLVDIPVYMRDYTEKAEYSYVINHKGLEGKILKRHNNWWIVSNGKWVVMGVKTKKAAQDDFVDFVDNRYEFLVEKGYIAV